MKTFIFHLICKFVDAYCLVFFKKLPKFAFKHLYVCEEPLYPAEIKELPENLTVGGNIDLEDFTGITSLPEGLTVGN